MRIKEITSQNRRDFYAIMECEHCGNTVENVSGYDDAFFHANVIPKMKCKKCNKIAPNNYRALSTKYNENEII